MMIHWKENRWFEEGSQILTLEAKEEKTSRERTEKSKIDGKGEEEDKKHKK